jgi:hypothetical protein
VGADDADRHGGDPHAGPVVGEGPQGVGRGQPDGVGLVRQRASRIRCPRTRRALEMYTNGASPMLRPAPRFPRTRPGAATR